MKKIQIQGKDYVTVNERVKEFHKLFPKGSIITKILSQTETDIVMQAVATPDCAEPNRWFSGIAHEVKGSGPVNKTSHFENCETSAVGRALGFLGIGIDSDIASADEMKALQNDTPITDQQIATLRDYIVAVGADEAKYLKYLKVDRLDEIMSSQFLKAVNALKAKGKKK
jgi:hypothetical protein